MSEHGNQSSWELGSISACRYEQARVVHRVGQGVEDIGCTTGETFYDV